MPYAELFVDQGSTYENTIDLTADDGTAVNVAGYVFSGQVRKSYYSQSVAANLTITVVNTANGNIKMSMNSSTTANIKAGRYVYDVKMKDTSNNTTRILEGIITVTPQVTK